MPKPNTLSVDHEMTAVLDGYGDPAILLSPDYRVLAANRAYLERYAPAGGVAGGCCYELSHHSDRPCAEIGEACPLQDAESSRAPQRVLHIHHSPRGEEHVEVEGRPIFDAHGRLHYFIEIIRPSHTASLIPDAGGMVGRAPPFRRMLELIERVAPSEAAALLLGESGAGKELAAQAIHQRSRRAAGKFVPLECSGLTESLFESELFGHEKGAFTGAASVKEGLVEAAREGTLFLDEVGDIPLALQVKLLRLLETGTYRRVGGTEPRQADFRLICATHRDLKGMVAEGRFRQDLYYRINTFPIRLPALRERSEDIPLLAETLLRRIPSGKSKRLAVETRGLLERYPFPGNIRELRNILERASLMADGELIMPTHLPEEVWEAMGASPEEPPGILTLEEVERRYLVRLSREFTGSRQELAARLGVSERTLFRKLRGI